MKILIAEDNKIDQLILKEYLKTSTNDIKIVSDGLSAWDYWNEYHPELIITDLFMPKMTGFELIEKIRNDKFGVDTFIITITGSETQEELEQSFKYGTDDFIIKPIKEIEFKYRLEAASRRIQMTTAKSLIVLLTKLTSFRDDDTHMHMNRIQNYVSIIAHGLKEKKKYHELLTDAYINDLILASPIHDIGKIGIEDELLKTQRVYTLEERQRMKKHVIIGGNIMDDIIKIYPYFQYLYLGKEIALYHHEKFDGTGYPYGLKGEEIPLSARIVALADVFDALVSKRNYKDKLSFDVSLEIIFNESGKYFDPDILEVLYQNKDKFEQIMESIYEDDK